MTTDKPLEVPLIGLWGYRISDPYEPQGITLLWPDKLDWACQTYGDRFGFTLAFTVPHTDPPREYFEQYERERAAVLEGVPEHELCRVDSHALWVYRGDGYQFQTNELGEIFRVEQRDISVNLIEDHGRRRWLGRRLFTPAYGRDHAEAFREFCEGWAAESPRFEDPCKCSPRRYSRQCRACVDL
jgi:hypothetical protein